MFILISCDVSQCTTRKWLLSVNLEKCPEYSRVFITLIEGAAIFMRICLIKIDRKFIRVLNLSLRMHFNPLVIPKSSHENKTNIFSKLKARNAF